MATDRTFRPLFGRPRKVVQMSQKDGPDSKAAERRHRLRTVLEAEIDRLDSQIATRFSTIRTKDDELGGISKQLRKMPRTPSHEKTLKQREQQQVERELKVLRRQIRQLQAVRRRKNRQLRSAMK